eukprot:c28622_g3_i2 orf=1757-2209(+)
MLLAQVVLWAVLGTLSFRSRTTGSRSPGCASRGMQTAKAGMVDQLLLVMPRLQKTKGSPTVMRVQLVETFAEFVQQHGVVMLVVVAVLLHERNAVFGMLLHVLARDRIKMGRRGRGEAMGVGRVCRAEGTSHREKAKWQKERSGDACGGG